jgi:hypothetical protein
VNWQSVCGLPGCQEVGPCAARGQAARLMAAIRVEALVAGPGESVLEGQPRYFMEAANIWIVTAAVCEMPDGERRQLAGRLLDEHWPESCGMDSAGQAKALAELLEVVDAILARPLL